MDYDDGGAILFFLFSLLWYLVGGFSTKHGEEKLIQPG